MRIKIKMKNRLENKRIAIIGGGPGGLTLARLLQQKNVEVKVYERDVDKSIRQQGATLDLHDESGLKALTAAGLIEEFKANYRPNADKMRICDAKANILYDDHEAQQADEFGNEHFRPEIDRGPLRDILINSLLPNTIVWDAQFVEMKALEGGWEVFFKNGNTAYADIVVAVDGANSKIRPYLSDLKPVYSEITVVEGNIYDAERNALKLWELVKGGKVFALGNAKTIILSAKGDGTLSFYTGTKETENWVNDSPIDFKNREEIFDWFKIRFADWSEDWYELFESEDTSFVPRPMYHFPSDQSWETRSNLTMIGDAAHRIPPYAGEGVNMAMQDALELAEALTDGNFATTKEAIAYFEQQMLNRMLEITEQTLANTEMLHSANGLNDFLRFFDENVA
jgi:2-polyprenyl-6-methoxyphenol hydroxylase-like FAD-dependent oxidoreductase